MNQQLLIPAAAVWAALTDLSHEPPNNPEAELEEISAILYRHGITYDDLMTELKAQRARTIQTAFPGLERLYREVNPNGEILS